MHQPPLGGHEFGIWAWFLGDPEHLMSKFHYIVGRMLRTGRRFGGSFGNVAETQNQLISTLDPPNYSKQFKKQSRISLSSKQYWHKLVIYIFFQHHKNKQLYNYFNITILQMEDLGTKPFTWRPSTRRQLATERVGDRPEKICGRSPGDGRASNS